MAEDQLEAPPLTNQVGRSTSTTEYIKLQLSSWWRVYSQKEASFWLLLGLSSLTMLVAFPTSSLLFRLYYVDGGSQRWFLAWVGSAAWPVPGLFLLALYVARGTKPTPLTRTLAACYSCLGLLSAADNLMFAWSYAYLPASTSTLLSSSSLSFTAIFAYLLVNKKLNAFSFNAIGIMTAGAVILGLDSSSDRPPGTSQEQYWIGFVLALLGSALHGLIFVLSEMVFLRVLRRKAVHLILEVQTMTSLFACLFTTVGVVISGQFAKVPEEAEKFRHGPVTYGMVLVWSSVANQLGVLAGVAVLYLMSALLSGVLNSAAVPLTATAAAICFGDNMSGFKVMSLLLTLWSFGSYIYGGFLEAGGHI